MISGEYEISADKARLDLDVIHGFLSQSYWAQDRPRAITEKAMAASDCFGVYHGATQVGFARVITDRATFAWLCDVFVVPEHRGRGLAVRLLEFMLAWPPYVDLRRWTLSTQDAHGLYEKFGFGLVPAGKLMAMQRGKSS